LDFEIIRVYKKFGDKYALQNVSLKGEKGKIIAIIGPSGSGKTTLLRIINLLEKPSGGTQRIDGKDPYLLSKTERYKLRTRMALVFQNPCLFQRSVEDNVIYGLRIRNKNRKEAYAEVNSALKLVGIEELRNKFAPNLSAGEAQRVSFARAIVVKPELLLLDEFTANLDHLNVKLLEESVAKYHEQTKATIVLATHNLFQAKRLAEEVVFILDGKIIEIAKKEEFFSNPKNPLTKSFLSGELY
jgi:tungstate transport system ATP-binding protein